MFFEIGVIQNFPFFIGKHLFRSLFFSNVAGLKACNFVKKKTPTQVLFCEICKIFKNNSGGCL